MKPTATIILVAMLSVVTAFATVKMAERTSVAQAQKESVYDRVMQTGILRCGYSQWSVFLKKDPNTNRFSGIYYDYMETLGKNLDLKIVWAEEMGDENNVSALVSGRVDAYCSILFWNAQRAQQADFTTPLFYMTTEIYVRADDARFDNDLAAINRGDVKIVAVDGDIFARIADADFPKAKKVSLPQLASEADIFMSVTTGKADIVLMEPVAAAQFMREHPGQIKRVVLKKPLRYSPVSLMIKGGEDRLRRMLDIATAEMQGDGTIEKIIAKYELYPDMIYRPALPFAKVENKE